MWKSSSDPFPSRARHGTKKNQSFGDMRIPGNIGPVSLVPVCAMRVINGLPPANLICFIINPTKAVWGQAGCWSACEYRWRGQVTIPPMATIITVCTVSALSTLVWSCPASAPLTVMLGQYSTAAAVPLFSTCESCSVNILMVILMDWGIFPMRLNKYC